MLPSSGGPSRQRRPKAPSSSVQSRRRWSRAPSNLIQFRRGADSPGHRQATLSAIMAIKFFRSCSSRLITAKRLPKTIWSYASASKVKRSNAARWTIGLKTLWTNSVAHRGGCLPSRTAGPRATDSPMQRIWHPPVAAASLH